MRALKKHKILVINIFPLESFNGTIELKFKNPLVLSFFFNIFVSTLSPRIHLLLQCWFFSSFASPSLFLYIFFFVITTAFNYVYKYVYSKKTAELVRFATFKSLFERKSLEKKKKEKEKIHRNCKIS